MDCKDGTTLIGEYWSYVEPTQYKFRYFEFDPARGGMASHGASLVLEVDVDSAPALIDSILGLKENYPLSDMSSQTAGSTGLKLKIFGYHLYDFDFNFALEIETLISESLSTKQSKSVNENFEWGEVNFHRPIVKKESVSLNESGIKWSGASPYNSTGLAKSGFRIEIHHKGNLNENEFLSELRKLIDINDIEYLEYKKTHDQNYSFYIGNGRQGMNGLPVNCFNFANFQRNLLKIIEKFGFTLDFDPERTGYGVRVTIFSELEDLKPIVLKDERQTGL